MDWAGAMDRLVGLTQETRIAANLCGDITPDNTRMVNFVFYRIAVQGFAPRRNVHGMPGAVMRLV